MADLRHQRLSQSVQSLLVLEDKILASLQELDPRIFGALPDGYMDTIATHRQALVDYQRAAGDDSVAATNTVPTADVAALCGGATIAGPLSAAVTSLYALLSYAAIRYAAVFEMSLKLYDEKLRDLAPRHMNAHKDGAYSLAANLAETVAGELAGDGLECQCVCPMCSLGACGCVNLGHLVTVSPLALPDERPPDSGFTLEPPRTGSQLAEAGVVAGDLLVAIDDDAVAALLDIQAAIRKHDLGENIQLLIAHGGSTRRIEVTHHSDY